MNKFARPSQGVIDKRHAGLLVLSVGLLLVYVADGIPFYGAVGIILAIAIGAFRMARHEPGWHVRHATLLVGASVVVSIAAAAYALVRLLGVLDL